MIDSHVHLRDWNESEKETISHAMKVAALLGFTWLFDMPNTKPPLTEENLIQKRLEEGKSEGEKHGVRYSLYAGLTSDTDQVRRMVLLQKRLFPDVVGLKLFLSHSTGNMGIVGKKEQENVFSALTDASYRGVLVLHAEKESLNDMSLFSLDDFSTHSKARPSESEIESIRDALELADKTGFKGHLHIAHISTRKGVEEVLDAKKRNVDISMGATPHHALYTSDDAKDKKRYLKMNPPLRSEEDRAFIFSSLLEGKIDNVESDHAPHTLEDKERGASGIPSLPAMLLLMHKLRENGASEDHIKDLYGRNIQKIFNLPEYDFNLPPDDENLFEKAMAEYPVKSFCWV